MLRTYLASVLTLLVSCGGAHENAIVENFGETSNNPGFSSETFDVFFSGLRELSSVEGLARIFAKNPLDGVFLDVPLEFSGDGTLRNSMFVTGSASDLPRARESTHHFLYDPLDHRFREASVFANVNRMFAWFQDLDIQMDSKQVGLVVHGGTMTSRGDVTRNNVQYLPASGESMAKIIFGDGDGKPLRNLTTDVDVATHEYAHHIIFKFIPNTTGERAMLHEGLADFFANAFRNSPCLAPSIRNTEGPFCLRNAENNLKYTSNQIPSPHLRGQVISGFLWDLVESNIPVKTVSLLVARALQLASDHTTVETFVTSVCASDVAMNSGTNLRAIVLSARLRELPLAECTENSYNFVPAPPVDLARK